MANNSGVLIFGAAAALGVAAVIAATRPSEAAAPPTTGSLSGKVTDSATGAPIQGATVSLGSSLHTTDANGNYSIVEIPPGDYLLSFSAPGYATVNI
jgi:uncharacterized surface anchored protein